MDDDILVGTIIGIIEENKNETDPRDIQIDVEPFLEDKSAEFTKELWDLCQEAEKAPNGVPECLKCFEKSEEVNEKETPKRERSRSREHRHRRRSTSSSRGRRRSSRDRRYRHHRDRYSDDDDW